MANRKSPVVSPVLDNSPSEADKYVRSYKLDADEFGRIVRHVNREGIDKALQVRAVTTEALERLGAKPDLNKAVSGLPEASDQLNLQSFYVWCQNLPKGHRKAINQLKALHATAVARCGG